MRDGGLLKTILPGQKNLTLMIPAGEPLICRMTGALKTCPIKRRIQLLDRFQKHLFQRWVRAIQLAVPLGTGKAL